MRHTSRPVSEPSTGDIEVQSTTVPSDDGVHSPGPVAGKVRPSQRPKARHHHARGPGEEHHPDDLRVIDQVWPDPVIKPVLSALEAFALLGIDRTTGYRAIQDGTFPVPIIRVGHQFRVPTLALLRLLDPPDVAGLVTTLS